MSTLDLNQYHKCIKNNDICASLITLKTLYELADNSLSNIARRVELSEEEANSETYLLQQQEALIELAAKTLCSDINMISHKIDFFNTALLKTKAASDFGRADVLAKSIWEDCQMFL